MRSRTLYVKRFTLLTIRHNWGMNLLRGETPNESRYMQCTAKGEVNWDKGLVYHPDEIIQKMQEKKPVIVIV
jgi:hypothetical protein